MTDILGRPITGDIDKGYKRKAIEQWDAARLVADIDAVFAADPDIAAINWTQYTPYFNDGDPCEFRSYLNDDAVVAIGQVPYSWYYDEAEDEEGKPVETRNTSYYSTRSYEYNPVTKNWDYRDKEIAEKDQAMATLIENWQHYEAITREHFGEHSRVIATREGFNVEYYEHD
jgi:hypothetical protein